MNRRNFRKEYKVCVKEDKIERCWDYGIFSVDPLIPNIATVTRTGFKTREKAVKAGYAVLDDWQYREDMKTEWEPA
jgi:hypothetical protein